MYTEETDWCYRARRGGWSVHYLPDGQVVHWGGQSSAAAPARRRDQVYRSKWLFLRKHVGWRTAATFRAGRPRRFGAQARRGRPAGPHRARRRPPGAGSQRHALLRARADGTLRGIGSLNDALRRGWSARRPAIALFLVLLACYAYFPPRWAEWNQNSRFDLVLAIVDDHSVQIDRYVANTGDYAYLDGHYYSDKAPGTALLGVPVYAAFRALAPAGPAGAPVERGRRRLGARHDAAGGRDRSGDRQALLLRRADGDHLRDDGAALGRAGGAGVPGRRAARPRRAGRRWPRPRSSAWRPAPSRTPTCSSATSSARRCCSPPSRCCWPGAAARSTAAACRSSAS